MALAAGTRLGPYEILAPLGAGAMGEVYLARDSRLDREVALKLLPERMTRDPESIARFRREALALASLNHPNIATVHGFEESPGGPMVLVLERVEGETLSQRLRRGPLAIQEGLQVCTQVALALELAHERGIVHRDVKPGNIMIGPRGIVKVLDFGLARRLIGIKDETETPMEGAPVAEPFVFTPPSDPDEDAPTIAIPPMTDGTVSLTGWTVGTPGYMSPEQVTSQAADARADIFAFACVLFECLTARRAFTGAGPIEIMRATLEAEVALERLPARTPDRVRNVLEQCLKKLASDRPPEMRLVRIELEEALGIRRASALREGVAYATPNNLPQPPTSFVGREALLAKCAQTLDRTRLLTLAGLGGSGKTRVALELARQRLEHFTDGVWFVDLAPLLEPERVAEAMAAVLGVRGEPGRPLLGELVAALSEKRALVLFDNCETQLEAAAALATQLLRGSRELKVLLTSREPLDAEGEVVAVVPALTVPDAGVASAAAALANESVRLFVERARAAHPGFELEAASVRLVVEICARLDGLPLALELAAARVRMLGVEQIRERLDDRFRLLTRAAGGSARQQTVHATIAWSFEHLLPPEQALFWKLAAFTGGWTLDRAVPVCSDSGDEFEVLDLLTRLVERALVVVQREGEQVVRYRFLESVWRFALERAVAEPQWHEIRDRHLAVHLDFAEWAERALTGAELPRRLPQVAAEEANLLAALDWAVQSPQRAESGMRIAAACHRYWNLTGNFGAILRASREALAADPAATATPVRARLLTRLAGAQLVTGEHAAALSSLEESLAIVRANEDRPGTARVLAGLSVAALWLDDFELARRHGEESLALYQRLGQTRGIALARHNLATILRYLGRLDEAVGQFEAALETLRRIDDPVGCVLGCAALGSAYTASGRGEEARRALHESLVFQARGEGPREGVYVLESMAEWLAAGGRMIEAAHMLGAARSVREAYRLEPMKRERADMEAVRARIEGALGAEPAANAMAEGASLELRGALVEAGCSLGR